ncbi:uncharacterized protein LOC128210463 [Mya arenaria]|uniref:uncharacterized protein LOC128210463 n=1 Tax=Mya arenaria TaxID=6604 RepID=UPI0022E76484|nr:uncharacterized protein LOC128210463 [Mya arenaria]
MDICSSILDVCSLVNFAPCPPPDIESHTFYEHLAGRNLTVLVVLHIAERCGMPIIHPILIDRTRLKTFPATEIKPTTKQTDSEKININQVVLIIVGLVFILIIINIVIIEWRKRSFHRSNKHEHAVLFNGQETVTLLTTKTNTTDYMPMNRKEDISADAKAEEHTHICKEEKHEEHSAIGMHLLGKMYVAALVWQSTTYYIRRNGIVTSNPISDDTSP